VRTGNKSGKVEGLSGTTVSYKSCVNLGSSSSLFAFFGDTCDTKHHFVWTNRLDNDSSLPRRYRRRFDAGSKVFSRNLNAFGIRSERQRESCLVDKWS
jgi:hypothetical protein